MNAAVNRLYPTPTKKRGFSSNVYSQGLYNSVYDRNKSNPCIKTGAYNKWSTDGSVMSKRTCPAACDKASDQFHYHFSISQKLS